jgi:ribosomal protein S18 acetylase RimI-like enzyme
MILRDARPAERQALEDLQRRASLMWDNYRPYLLANPEAIELPLAHIGRTRVAEEAGIAVGFSVVLQRGDVADLDGLFVEPRHWSRGIGRRLVEDAVARAQAAGSAVLEVVGNDNALGFYDRLGFAVCGLAQTQFGPAKRLRLILKTA